jgi:hypothetical protein
MGYRMGDKETGYTPTLIWCSAVDVYDMIFLRRLLSVVVAEGSNSHLRMSTL